MIRNSKLIFCIAFALISFVSCGFNDDSSEVETTTTVTTREHVKTIKTAVQEIDVDDDDEDIEGYTTTEEVTGSLENSYSNTNDDPDEDILATWSTTTTAYTVPDDVTAKTTQKNKATSKQTTKKKTTTAATEFTADKLYNPGKSDKFKSKKKYKVTSDTTYLNLRYGPSKEYNVQLEIPDGEYIYGTALTSNPNNKDEKWVYVTYKGTSGWVMDSLLKAE